MNSRALQKRTSPRAQTEVKLDTVRANLRFGGRLAVNAIHKFKGDVDIKWMFSRFPILFKDERFRSLVVPSSFPRSVNELLKPNPLGIPHSYSREIYWAAAICLQFSSSLNSFIAIKNQFESAVLVGDRESSHALLERVRTEFGLSIWFIQNELIQIQTEFGLEAQKQKSRSRDENVNVILS